jgi:hypothetical protein
MRAVLVVLHVASIADWSVKLWSMCSVRGNSDDQQAGH